MKPDPDPTTNPTNYAADFSSKMILIMPILRAYSMSFIPNATAAVDVMQKIELFLWQNRIAFNHGSSFKSWAFKVAYFKALAAKKEQLKTESKIKILYR